MVKIEPEKARQGRWGWHVLTILVVGLILAVLVWLGVEFYGEQIDQPQPAEQSQQSQ